MKNNLQKGRKHLQVTYLMLIFKISMQPSSKKRKDLSRHFSKEDIQINGRQLYEKVLNLSHRQANARHTCYSDCS